MYYMKIKIKKKYCAYVFATQARLAAAQAPSTAARTVAVAVTAMGVVMVVVTVPTSNPSASRSSLTRSPGRASARVLFPFYHSHFLCGAETII